MTRCQTTKITVELPMQKSKGPHINILVIIEKCQCFLINKIAWSTKKYLYRFLNANKMSQVATWTPNLHLYQSLKSNRVSNPQAQ